MAIASYTDVKTSRIPNWLSIGGISGSFIYYFVSEGWSGLLFSVLGCCVGGGLFMILYTFRALGAGDVKLFGAIGAMMGIEFTLYSMMYSIIYAGMIGIFILLFRKNLFAKFIQIMYVILEFVWKPQFLSLNVIDERQLTTFPFMYAVIPAVFTTSYYFH